MKNLPLKKPSAAVVLRYSLFAVVGLVHLVLILYFRFSLPETAQEAEPSAEVFKLVDVQEYVPPPPPKPEPVKEVVEVSEQPTASETIIEVEEEVVEVEQAPPVSREPDYLPQHKISEIPEIPAREILDRIVYPPMALRQNLEAVVIVELYIDASGLVRRVVVLRDPGHGFAEAALAALEGLRCTPARANGQTVAVRYRYPIRFSLK